MTETLNNSCVSMWVYNDWQGAEKTQMSDFIVNHFQHPKQINEVTKAKSKLYLL